VIMCQYFSTGRTIRIFLLASIMTIDGVIDH
jgi:hypothetical protein